MPELDAEALNKLIDERAKKLFTDLHAPKADAASLASTPPTPSAKEPASEAPHLMRAWEKTCPDCGANNPEYRKPDLFCSDCGVPVGNLPPDFKVGAGEEKELDHKPCWNCGSDKFKVKQ